MSPIIVITIDYCCCYLLLLLLLIIVVVFDYCYHNYRCLVSPIILITSMFIWVEVISVFWSQVIWSKMISCLGGIRRDHPESSRFRKDDGRKTIFDFLSNLFYASVHSFIDRRLYSYFLQGSSAEAEVQGDVMFSATIYTVSSSRKCISSVWLPVGVEIIHFSDKTPACASKRI